MKTEVREAFIAVREDFPADRVIADPELNAAFVEACRQRGLDEPAAELNRALLNMRKAGEFTGLQRSRRTSFRDEEDYRFATEIAARCLEQQRRVTVDQIICDPDLAKEFDRLAAEFARDSQAYSTAGPPSTSAR